MKIRVAPIDEERFELTVQPTDTIKVVKGKIEDLKGFPSNQQCLTYRGVKLEDDCNLQSYAIFANHSILFLSVTFNMMYISYGHSVKFNVLPTDNYNTVAAKLWGNKPIELMDQSLKPIFVNPESTVGAALESSSSLSSEQPRSLSILSYEKFAGILHLKLKPNDTYDEVALKILENNPIKLIHMVRGTGGDIRFDCISMQTGDTIDNAIQRAARDCGLGSQRSTPIPPSSNNNNKKESNKTKTKAKTKMSLYKFVLQK